jgi:predicted AAA+ superfamily ATPase
VAIYVQFDIFTYEKRDIMTKIYRKVSAALEKWRNSKGRMPLLLYGARQVGKTFSAEEFGRESFSNSVTLNMEDSADLRAVFERDFDTKRIIRELSALSSLSIEEEKTLIIFDEIQASERALLSLKYFAERAPGYCILATGSLLGVAVNRERYSFPVGKVDMLRMHPLDFEEFLIAKGEGLLADIIREAAEKNSHVSLHEKAMALYREYLTVGGMPMAVSAHITDEGVDGHIAVLRLLDTAYIADMAKYATVPETTRIIAVYNSIPSQLAREKKKFKYSIVKEGAKRGIYESAIDWLSAAGTGLKSTKVTTGISPVAAYEDDAFFKIYLHDCGLLALKYGISPLQIISNTVQSRHVRGAMAENYVATALEALDKRCHYWSSDNTAEIDFVIEDEDGNVIPIEVKSAENTKSKSLAVYVERYHPPYAIKITAGDFSESNGIVTVPLYAAHCIDTVLERKKTAGATL